MLIDIIIPIASAIAAITGVGIAIYQAELSRRTTGADLLMRLEDRFDNEEFLEKRKNAVQAITNPSKETQGDIEEVLDFFETIGLLVHKKTLDKELAWSSFFYWLHGYCLKAKTFLEDEQKIASVRYCEALWLHKKLLEIELSKKPLDDTEWDEFLDEEAQSGFISQNRR